MSLADPPSNPRARDTWQRFLRSLVAQGVKDSQRPWYARRVEHYLSASAGRAPERPLRELDAFVRAKRPRKLPVVLSAAQARALLAELDGIQRLMASLLYGTGMRLMECVRLRVKDVDFDYRQIVVRDAKGAKDRVVPLPQALAADLSAQLKSVRETHRRDLERGFGAVFLPDALARKYPNAPREWPWQYVFPSKRFSVDPRSGRTRLWLPETQSGLASAD